MVCRLRGFPWPSLATRLYRLSLKAGLPCYILYQYIAVVVGSSWSPKPGSFV